MIRRNGYRLLVIVALLALIALLWRWGGPANPVDVATIRSLQVFRQNNPTLTAAAIAVTQMGSAYATVGLALLVAASLLILRQSSRAGLLAATVIGARLLGDLFKDVTNRPRPAFDLHPMVVTHSSSFPSGHASNSMAAFLALALFAAPPRWRRPALGVAIVASIAVGLTRPMLGVHWPSDVLAGWAFGAAIILAVTSIPLARRLLLAPQQQHQIVGGHGATLDQH